MPNLHRNVDIVYKLVLVLLSAVIAFAASSNAMLIFSFSVLWIMQDNIEKSVERAVQYIHDKYFPGAGK